MANFAGVNVNEEIRKWEFLASAPASDAKTPEIQSIAQALWLVARRSPWPEWCFAQLALALARDCVLYQLDTDRVGREQIDGYTDPQGPADIILTRGVDDCDGKARLFVAVCLAGGLPANMVPRWTGPVLSHVYAACSVKGPRDRAARNYFAETILRRAILGEKSDQVPREPDTGKWLF